MSQLALDFATPPVGQPRAVGQAAAKRAEKRAARVVSAFTERAKTHILALLGKLREVRGEALVNDCKANDIKPPDDRAFGAVFAALVREGLIRCVGFVPRAKGHGTAGGRVWRLVA